MCGECPTLADLAKYILDQCVVEGDLRDNPHDLDYSIAFNYEFIDDIQDDNEKYASLFSLARCNLLLRDTSELFWLFVLKSKIGLPI